jgi:hypothetical protein
MLAFKLRTIAYCLCLIVGLISTAVESQGQSLDVRSPSPVRRNEVVGRISARDLGDARLTDHFYTFAGTPGDLLVTIETRNLNGDIDVFTASGLRPLLKVAVYAESTAPVTKNIYLRQREEMILRIEARSPNDDDGVYRIRFSGTFEAMAGRADEEETVSLPTARKGKRVSSVGARIEDPTPPPVDVPSSASTPERTETATEDPAPMEVKKEPVVVEAPPVRSARNPRTRSTANSRRTATKPPAATETETRVEPKEVESSGTPSSSEPATTSEATSSTPESTNPSPSRNSKRSSVTANAPESSKRASSPRSRNAKKTTSAASADTTSTNEAAPAKNPESTTGAEEEAGGSKLVVELLDGTRVERFMTTVRRVTVENGQIVVISKDGKIERIRLSTVVRMSIGP